MDALALWTVSAITLVAILAAIEGGYRLGCGTRTRSEDEKDVAALYIDALNTVINVHASRVSVGIHARMPAGIWMALYALVMLSMVAVGYHTAIAGSRRTWMMLILGLSFSLVITLIVALDRPQGGYVPVSQQPLEDLRSAIDAAVAGQKVAH